MSVHTTSGVDEADRAVPRLLWKQERLVSWEFLGCCVSPVVLTGVSVSLTD